MKNIKSFNSFNEAKQIIEIPTTPNTITLWHGGNLDDLKNSLSHKTGRFEYGAGLYLTNSYEVVKNYAKGSRKLYLVTIEKGKEIKDCLLPFSKCLEFIKMYCKTSTRKTIISRLEKYIEDEKIEAEIFNNIILNEKAITASNTSELRDFLVENGVDYEITGNIGGWGGIMIILYNSNLITEIKRITSNDKIETFELSTKFNN